jgi:hypothetical protein
MAQNQMKIFHWQTESYAQHKAFGKVYDNLSGLIDDFVEVCMGKHGRPSFQGEFNIPLFSFSQLYNPETDSDLLNIRDEMLAEMNRLKYLLTLS